MLKTLKIRYKIIPNCKIFPKRYFCLILSVIDVQQAQNTKNDKTLYLRFFLFPVLAQKKNFPLNIKT